MANRGVRARRDGWASEVKVALTERDVSILYLVGTVGVARTRDVSRYFFGARATANDRLRKLYCAGYVDCFAPDLAGDNFYTLTHRGRDAVLDRHDLDPAVLRTVRKLPAKLAHHLAVLELRLHVAIACRDHPTYGLTSFDTDADLASERHAALLDLIPDARVTVSSRSTGETHAFFLEADLGTEAVTWLVRHKLAAYARHAQLGHVLYGVRDPVVVLVVPGLRRARNVARLMADQRVHARVVFALAPTLDETNVLGAAYALPDDLAADVDDDVARIFARRLLP